jgi:signal transduction histidine kinase
MGAERPGRTASVRFRATLGATAVVGVALVVAAVALVLFQRRSLIEDARLAARLRALAVAESLEMGSADPGLEVSEDEFVQVLGPNGEVVAASPNAAGSSPVALPGPGESVRVDAPFEEDPYLAVSERAITPGGTLTVVAGRTLDVVVEATQTMVALLAVGLPALLLVVALVTRRVVGRALRPVDEIRAEVDGISTTELHRRVPVPATGDEISRLAGTMNRMLDRLQRGRDRQRRFVSDAAHELRSPVATIRQHAELVLTHPGAVPPQELARTVLHEDLRLQQLVEDLLLLARMDERIEDVRPEPVDLDDIVLAEIERVRQTDGAAIDAHRLSGGRVTGDPRRLSRLVGNLLENAARHARSSVAVGLHEEGAEVVLQVDDDGPGIPKEDRRRVFERFVRLQAARDRDTGGAGLGLAIVAEVAAMHGGTSRALDSPLGGARFEVRLPRAD